MIIRWISLVPSKIVKLVEVRAVSAARWPAKRLLVSTNSARIRGCGWQNGQLAWTVGTPAGDGRPASSMTSWRH
jgi:hypothetical protein